MNHLHLGVADVDASASFYERLGFRPSVWHGDALFVRNDDGFDLALAPHDDRSFPAWFHFWCRLPDADAVRALQRAFTDDGYTLKDSGDFGDFVFFRVDDPDGYQVEVYWEPDPVT
jgi:catechol 2,3-dioxygenase-like lactoylglutathione lyase family enzyme